MTQPEWIVLSEEYNRKLREAVREHKPFPEKPIEIGRILMSDPKFRQVAMNMT